MNYMLKRIIHKLISLIIYIELILYAYILEVDYD